MASPPAQRILYGAALAFLGFLGCERVNVTAVDVATVEVSPPSLSLPPGGSQQLAARVLDENGDELMGRTVTWSSLDGAVATVSNDGEVSAVGNGSTTVTATAGGVSGEATVSVNVSGSIQLSESEIQFQTQQGGGVSSRNVQVTNGGSGTLTNLALETAYDGSESPWLSPALNQDVSPAILTVATNAGVVSSLGPGTYTAQIVIYAANAANSPLALPVDLTITTPDPAIGVSPASPQPFTIIQGEGPGAGGTHTVSVTNIGGGGAGALTGLDVGQISYGSGGNNWLDADLDGDQSPATLELSLRSAVSSLSAGDYTATVPLTSPVATNSPRNVSVTLTVGPESPELTLDSASVSFQAVVGGDPPGAKYVGVRNTGGGTLGNVTVSESAPWLQAVIVNNPRRVELTVDVSGLGADDDRQTTVTVNAQAPNSPQSFTVNLEMLEAPQIVVAAPTAFEGQELGATPSAQDVSISNGGGGTLTGLSATVIGYDPDVQPWLNATTLTDPLRLRLAPTRVPAEGTYKATVEVTSTAPGADTATVEVTFNVSAAASISLNRTTVPFSTTQGSSPPNQTVDVSNGGGGALTGLDWGVSYGPGATGWLSTTSFNQDDAPAILTLRVTSGSVAPGNYTATVTVDSPVAAEDADIAVTLQVAAQPSISLNPTSVTFDEATAGGSNPPNEQVQITNGGDGTLNGLDASESADWLTVSVPGGAAPVTMTLTVDISTLSAGPHSTNVTVSGNGVPNQTLPVSITVNPPPASISLNPTSVTFDDATAGGSNPPNEQVQITNAGGGTLNGLSASENADWLTVSVPGGPAPVTMTLTADIGALSAGPHSTNVTVSGNGVPNQTLPVSITVNPPPASISLNPTSVTFDEATAGGSSPPNEQVQITNGGGGTLNGLSASENADWLTVSVPGGPAPVTMTLTADIGALSAGPHSANVTISGNGVSDATLPVSLTVSAPAAVISLENASVTFDDATAGGSNPPDEQVEITNGGGGTLDGLDASDNVDWLTTALSAANAPSTLTLSADITGLGAETHEATVTITSASADEASLTVSLTVSPAAVLMTAGAAHPWEKGAMSTAWLGHHAGGVAEHASGAAPNVSVAADQADTNAGDNETSASVVVS